ncbi:hypothetical protein REPUB_Repub01dG0194500 [Reevesia pubescens]
MEVEVDEKDLKSAGAEVLKDGRRGLRIQGWEIESRKRSILNSPAFQQWEQNLQTSHLPEMVFGESCLVLKHISSGTKIHFNAFDALAGWKLEGLPPVEVPAAAQWKFRSKPFQQVILDYDYTFTTPYSGSEMVELDSDQHGSGEISGGSSGLHWEDCKEQLDMGALTLKEPILFYDEVVLYEDELADNGVSLLTVKVRVMPSSWFLLLRFWLRVDGVLMRLRDTRMHCVFDQSQNPVILRERCWRESTFQALSAKGYPTDSASYSDPSIISQRLPVIMQQTQKLIVPDLEMGRLQVQQIDLVAFCQDLQIRLWIRIVLFKVNDNFDQWDYYRTGNIMMENEEEIGLTFVSPFLVLFPQHAFADKCRCVQLVNVAANLSMTLAGPADLSVQIMVLFFLMPGILSLCLDSDFQGNFSRL